MHRELVALLGALNLVRDALQLQHHLVTEALLENPELILSYPVNLLILQQEIDQAVVVADVVACDEGVHEETLLGLALRESRLREEEAHAGQLLFVDYVRGLEAADLLMKHLQEGVTNEFELVSF